eukprot:SAG31_NODE_763_length_12265_cov_3.024984_16_plen_117_part_00
MLFAQDPACTERRRGYYIKQNAMAGSKAGADLGDILGKMYEESKAEAAAMDEKVYSIFCEDLLGPDGHTALDQLVPAHIASRMPKKSSTYPVFIACLRTFVLYTADQFNTSVRSWC